MAPSSVLSHFSCRPSTRARHPDTGGLGLRGTARLVLLAFGLVTLISLNADAQTTRPPLRVQLHVAAEEAVKTSAIGYLTAALRPVTDVEITNRDADYVLSLMILPTIEGGYAISTVVMNVYSDRRLDELSTRWQLTPAAGERLRGVFKGTGALLDQRVRTGPNLQSLCDDIARGVDADVFAIERRARNNP